MKFTLGIFLSLCLSFGAWADDHEDGEGPILCDTENVWRFRRLMGQPLFAVKKRLRSRVSAVSLVIGTALSRNVRLGSNAWIFLILKRVHPRRIATKQ